MHQLLGFLPQQAAKLTFFSKTPKNLIKKECLGNYFLKKITTFVHCNK